MTCASCKFFTKHPFINSMPVCGLTTMVRAPNDAACSSFNLNGDLAASTVEDDLDIGTDGDDHIVYDDTSMKREIVDVIARHQCTDIERIRTLLEVATELTYSNQ